MVILGFDPYYFSHYVGWKNDFKNLSIWYKSLVSLGVWIDIELFDIFFFLLIVDLVLFLDDK